MSRSRKSRKSTENTKVADHFDEPSNCIICLETVSCRGKLSVCNHWFCFPCILEWAENTNTCPICKARFRCITKVHLSPFKSPPTKVRVGDKDQRVWNDDDDLVAEDVFDALDLVEDDLDDDYEPPIYISNPWSRSLQTRGRQREPSQRRRLPRTSRQLHLDQYDLEDSFIDDTDDVLQEFLYSTYSREIRRNNGNIVDIVISDHGDDDDDDDHSEEEEEYDMDSSNEEIVVQRDEPYTLRDSHRSLPDSSRTTTNSLDSREITRNSVVADDDYDDDDNNDDGEEEEETDTARISNKIVAQKNKHYPLRNSSRTKTNSIDRLLQLTEEQSCGSPASSDSFIVSDNESDDDLSNDWTPSSNYSKNSRNRCRNRKSSDDLSSDWLWFGNHSKNSKDRGKNRNQANSRRLRSNSKWPAGPSSTRLFKQSQRSKQVSDQIQNNSKRKRQQTYISDEELQELTSSRDRQVETLSSANGWINTARKQARAHTSTLSSDQRTRKKASANVNRSKNTRTKPRNPVESRESSSDSDMEVLGDKTKIKELPCHKRNNQFNKVNNLGMKKKQHISSCTPSTSSFIAMNEVTPNNSSDDESNLSDAMIVQPTPCSKTTRSIFTKRRHRSPISTFDQLDDTEEHHLCELQTQNKKRHSPKCTNRTLNTPGRKKTKAAFTAALRSDVQITLSPFVNTKKQKRKRIKSISSDSD